MIQNFESLELHQVFDFQTLIRRASAIWPDKPALIFDETGRSITFKEIEARTHSIACGLQRLGIQKGDHIAVMLRNIPEFPLCWLSIGKLGAVMVPMNVQYQEFDARYVLEHSRARMIITDKEFLPLIQKIKGELPILDQIVLISDESEQFPSVQSLMKMSGDDPLPNVFSEDLINIQYTSGTTGLPKGCMLSQNYWLNIARKIIEHPFPAVQNDDVLLTAQPFYYMDPQWNVVSALATGATLVILNRFRPSLFWEKVRQYKVTFFYCLGNMPVLLLKMPHSPLDQEHHIRAVGCSAIPKQLHHEIERRWGVKWYEIFGMTETGFDLSMTVEDHDLFVGTGALGRPRKDREVRVVDDYGKSVDRGEVGELVLRGSGMMDGYYKNEAATNEVFRNGWFHTGDLARIDESGIVYYVGRKKEMIRRSSENISATEVEDVIRTYPAVSIVAAVPVADEIRGEEVKVYIVLKSELDEKETEVHHLIQHCINKLASFKIPRYWEFREELPMTPSERVAKHILMNEREDLRLHSYDRVEFCWR